MSPHISAGHYAIKPEDKSMVLITLNENQEPGKPPSTPGFHAGVLMAGERSQAAGHARGAQVEKGTGGS